MKTSEEIEYLIIRQVNHELTAAEEDALAVVLANNAEMASLRGTHQSISKTLPDTRVHSFGPFFASRVLHQIQKKAQEFDSLVFYFFKKYQAVAVGIAVALLAANVFLADQFTLASILGLDEQSLEEIVTVNVYNSLDQGL